MNTRRTIIIAGLVVALACAITSVIAVKRQQAARAEARLSASLKQQGSQRAPKTALLVAPVNSPVNEAAPTLPIEVETLPTEKANHAAPIRQPQTSQDLASAQPPAARKPGSGKAPAQDPLAREALSYVGADPEANTYWATAINNPDLPAEERKDLIEDLNEDGLSDPKHPGPEDVPLILNRI